MFTGFVAIFIFPTVKDGILSHCKTEKKIFMVSAWLVFGYGWSVFG